MGDRSGKNTYQKTDEVIRPIQPVKKFFDRLADGGASSPATTTPTRFHLNPADSGREICKETIFLLENGIFRQKNRCGRDVHAAAPDCTCCFKQLF